MLRVHNTIKCSWSGCFRCKSWKEQCGTREDSPGRNGLLASSSGCNLFSISMIQVSEWCSCTTNGIFAPSIKKNLNILQWIQKLHWQLVLMHFFPGQVDWAALAQAWIAQKESTGGEQQNIQPNGQDIPGLESVGQNNHSNFQGDPAFGRMWQPGTQLSLWAMALPLGKKTKKLEISLVACLSILCLTEWGMHGQPPPPPPPDQAWIPPGSGPMDVVNPSEDSNSQDSVEFNSEAHHGVYPQNSHGYGAQPDSYAMAPMAMNQFDYQVCRCYGRNCWSVLVLVWQPSSTRRSNP